MTSEVKLYLRFHNVRIHYSYSYQNRLLNEYAREKKTKISKSLNHGVPSLLVRYRRTYVLNNSYKTNVTNTLYIILTL